MYCHSPRAPPLLRLYGIRDEELRRTNAYFEAHGKEIAAEMLYSREAKAAFGCSHVYQGSCNASNAFR